MQGSIILSVLAAFGLGYAGMVALALAMQRHHEQVFTAGQPADDVPAKRCRLLRILGVLLLSAALLACAQGFGWWRTPVVGLGVLSIASLLLIVLLPYRARLAVQLSGWFTAVGLLLLLVLYWQGGGL